MCRILSALIMAGLPWAGSSAAQEDRPLPEFRLPPGFRAEVLVDDLPFPRSMAWGEQGTLFVGTLRAGKVLAIRNPMSGHPRVLVIAHKRKMPNGVAFRDGALYVAEVRQIVRYPDIEAQLEAPGEPELVTDALPYRSFQHAWKYLDFGPDGRLYVPIGMPCNVCNEPGFGRILSMKPDGTDIRTVATGVRNSVGFAWHPKTGELWFTDNGRDLLGDEIPADELNRVGKGITDFGFPYCHAGDIADPEFGDLGRCQDARAPVQKLDPHAAALGMLFYTGDMFPAGYRSQIFIAEHGSWNRTPEAGKTGYRVSLVRLDGNRAVSYEPFLEGFVDGDEILGRPVDLLLAPDGSLLVSDDRGGRIYRISYHEPVN
ncbi:MAG TPA: sorbosone dehydrogenase family protein [Chromatiales bacterium]|nr:sorbosone dehydrogenase family protein [Chromatiales bacterium]